MVNVRTKGQTGEREVCGILNSIVKEVRISEGYAPLEPRDELFQRNQNQSAVGGSDLTNPLGLEIEVKRQEALSLNTWWKQTTESANRTGGIPILIYKQNRKKWRIQMLVDVPLQMPNSTHHVTLQGLRAEMDLESFQRWFRTYCFRNEVWRFPK